MAVILFEIKESDDQSSISGAGGHLCGARSWWSVSGTISNFQASAVRQKHVRAYIHTYIKYTHTLTHIVLCILVIALALCKLVCMFVCPSVRDSSVNQTCKLVTKLTYSGLALWDMLYFS